MIRSTATCLFLSMLAACSIQRDVPDFDHPVPQSAPDAQPPELQPTAGLIPATPLDQDVYTETASALEARKNTLLRRAAQGPQDQPEAQ